MVNKFQEPFVVDGDITPDLLAEIEVNAKESGIAVDIETTGLSTKSDKIEVISIAVDNRPIVVALSEETKPYNLLTLLENGSILKIFHHAFFDFSFLSSHWQLILDPVFCTKVAARIAGIDRNPTLEYLINELLGVSIDKGERLSDWGHRPLTQAQVQYAARDVLYLHQLERELRWKLSDCGRTALFESCMRFLPSRIELGLMGFGDIYAYEV